MLSSVLNNERAIQVNIQIMRIYVRMKELILDNKEIWFRLIEMENDVEDHQLSIKQIFTLLNELAQKKLTPRTKIGFKRNND